MVTINIALKLPLCIDRILVWPLLLYRRLRYGYPFRRIPLGSGLFTIVDSEDFYTFNKYRWCAKVNGPRIYAVRLVSSSNNRTRILSLHREILNPPSRLLVDHRNRKSLDNRRANLRCATHSQNQFNKSKTTKKTTSRYIGVFLEKRSNRWVARIVHHKKRIWLGRFDSEIDAAKAYDKAALKYHGEFARLNFSE